MPSIITATQLRNVLGVSSTKWTDAILDDIINTAEQVVLPMLKELPTGGTWVGNSTIESAVYMICTEVFQSRISAGGSIEGVDMSPSPFKLGRSLFNKVSGLLGDYIDVETIIQ